MPRKLAVNEIAEPETTLAEIHNSMKSRIAVLTQGINGLFRSARAGAAPIANEAARRRDDIFRQTIEIGLWMRD